MATYEGTLVLINQFGEESINTVQSQGTTYPSGSDVTSALLTGFVSGAGTVAASDTILQGINKLSGNLQNRAVTANLLTGLAAGSNTPIVAGNTILVALANLQAQIDAL